MRGSNSIAEALAMFGLIMAYIWWARTPLPYSWTAIVGAMLLSHVLHRETPAALGFGARNLGRSLRDFGPSVLGLAMVWLANGTAFGTLRPLNLETAAIDLAGYLPWGLAQQYMINGYFLNRFEAGMPASKRLRK
jgi:hypothetical protein